MTSRIEPVSEADYAALADFRQTLRQFLHFSAEAARGAGLSAEQHQALLAIKGFGVVSQISVGELAERLDRKPHTTVGLVDRLAKAGLVKRVPDPADGRRVRLALTRAGENRLEKLSAVHRDELRRLRPVLSGMLARL